MAGWLAAGWQVLYAVTSVVPPDIGEFWKRVHRAFTDIDRNGNGELGADELKRILGAKYAKTFMQDMDVAGSGFVDRTEWEQRFRRLLGNEAGLAGAEDALKHVESWVKRQQRKRKAK